MKRIFGSIPIIAVFAILLGLVLMLVLNPASSAQAATHEAFPASVGLDSGSESLPMVEIRALQIGEAGNVTVNPGFSPENGLDDSDFVPLLSELGFTRMEPGVDLGGSHDYLQVASQDSIDDGFIGSDDETANSNLTGYENDVVAWGTSFKMAGVVASLIVLTAAAALVKRRNGGQFLPQTVRRLRQFLISLRQPDSVKA